MQAIETLLSEHRLIERVVEVLEHASARLDAGEGVAPSVVSEAVAFLQRFMPSCHEAKEEQVLFPAMVDHGMSGYGGPICVMLFEHQRGHDLAGALSAAVTAWAGGDISASRNASVRAREYTAFLRAHIAKEEQILFPAAKRIIPADQDPVLVTRLADLGNEHGGHAAMMAYEHAVQRLEGELLTQQH